jgi:hypothetical protein
MSDAKLQKICDLELAGETLELAKNGQYRLVRQNGLDAYGRPIAFAVDLDDWLHPGGEFLPPRAQALVDALGDLTVRLRQQRDARLGGQAGEGEG